VQGGSGVRAGWYGVEAELYAGIFTFGAWGGYHDVVDNRVGITASSGFYAGDARVYPIPDLALTIGAGSEFSRINGNARLEFQPDLFARHNVAFFVAGTLAQPSEYSVTAGVRIYLGPDKPLIRRHREDDPDEVTQAITQLFSSYGSEYQALNAQAQAFHNQFVSTLQAGAGSFAEP
jgi:hypothetical protein